MNPENFARFLECLSPDVEEAGYRYTRLHQRLVGLFNIKGISDPVSAADETLDRAARKIYSGADVPDIDKYALGIARNIARERRRYEQREEAGFLNFIERLNNNSDEEVERIQLVLQPCFEQLPVEDQQLLAAYYHAVQGRARAEYRLQLAESMKITVVALRMRVTRLRSNLTDCARKQSEKTS